MLFVYLHDLHLSVGVLVVFHVQVLDGALDHLVGLEDVDHRVHVLVLFVVLSVLFDTIL